MTPSPSEWVATPAATLLLGQMARRLRSDDLAASLDSAARLLRSAAQADNCEIFLTEPEGADLLLASCQGLDRTALLQRTRFAPGVGFPGIAGSTGRPVVSKDLKRDRRFVRREVIRQGISAFATIPLGSGTRLVGCASLAWRGTSPLVDRGVELLEASAALMTAAIRSGLLAGRDRIEELVATAGADREAVGRAVLDALVAVSGARGGTLSLYQLDSREAAVISTARSVEICPSALDGRLRCGRVAAGHGVLLIGCRSGWPAECLCLPATTSAPICLPLLVHGRLQGVAVLDRGPQAPGSEPPGRTLVPLLTMGREAALLLANGERRSPGSPTEPGAVLEIRALGGFEVRLHGQLVPPEAFVRRKAMALLKLLVLNAGNPMSRFALVEHLWPGVDEKAGVNRLHGVLHALRGAIEPFREQRRWLYVCNIAEFYYFNMESAHWIDVYAFRRRAAAGNEAARRGSIQEAIRHFEAALTLYRGDLFADEPYAGWCELERADLRRRSVDLIGRPAALWTRAGDAERSLEWLRRGLRVDRLREDLHQALIRTLVQLGRRKEARAQYEACVGSLRQELGADPLPETRQLRALLYRPRSTGGA